jgi:hypothetical protein
MAAGNIILPHSPSFTPSPRPGANGEPTVADLDLVVAEAASFPKGKNDDAIDMISYAVNNYLTNAEGAGLAALAAATTAHPVTGLTIGSPPIPPKPAEVQEGLAMLSLAKPPGGV